VFARERLTDDRQTERRRKGDALRDEAAERAGAPLGEVLDRQDEPAGRERGDDEERTEEGGGKRFTLRHGKKLGTRVVSANGLESRVHYSVFFGYGITR
jgi:hypothetical protein